MNCKSARDQSDDGEMDAELAAHLVACADCRSEAEFRAHVQAAVVGMPRAAAPEGLLAFVMAELHGLSQQPETAVPPRPIALRGWELVSLGVTSLLLIALLPMALVRWLPGSFIDRSL